MKKRLSFFLRILVAFIYIQTLYFKFSAHPDSVYIFKSLGLEPYGRIIIGVLELLVAVGLFIPRIRIYAILLSISIIGGAIMAHLGPLGLEVQGDDGAVFYMAMAVAIASLGLLGLHKYELPFLFKRK